MNFKISPRSAFTISAVLFLAILVSCAAFIFVSCENGGNGDNNLEETVVTSADYTYITDISAVASALDTKDGKYLVLANKTVTVGADYMPDSLIPIDSQYTLYGKQISLSGNSALAAVAMIEEMRASGITNVYITSGYRSYEYQQTLFNNYCAVERAAHPDFTEEQIRETVLRYSAAPGTSEHQSGLCMDLFVSPGMLELENYGHEGSYPNDIGFAETEAFAWLEKNAHKFGFILRYPEDKTEVTGYSYESWHYRFVGIDAASKIFENKITLEEYLNK